MQITNGRAPREITGEAVPFPALRKIRARLRTCKKSYILRNINLIYPSVRKRGRAREFKRIMKMDITALAASPVSESQPAGADAKYEPEYEALTAEIGKLSSVSQSSPVSWQAVAGNGAVILAQEIKGHLPSPHIWPSR